MIPSKKVEELILKHKSLEGELSSGDIDKKLFAAKSKEYSDLNEIISQAKKYLNFEKNKNDLEKLIEENNNDKEIKEMAQIELDQLIKNNEINEKKIKLFLLPKDDADSKNAINTAKAELQSQNMSLADPSMIAQSAITRANALNELPQFNPLTKIFNDATYGLATQMELEARGKNRYDMPILFNSGSSGKVIS